MIAALAAAWLAAAAAAQEAAAPPAAETAEAPAASALPAPSLSEPKPEPVPVAPAKDPAPQAQPAVEAPAPKPEPQTEPKAEPKPETKAEAKPSKPAGPEDEWAFAKAAAEDADASIAEASMEDLKVFVRRHPDAASAPEAMILLADLRQKAGEWKPAMTTLLRLLYEYPGTKVGLKAKSAYLELVDKRASRKHREALSAYVSLPDTKDKADRLAALWLRVVDEAPDAFYESAAEELRDFSVRFPAHPRADELQAALARLHAANQRPAAALLAWRKLLALHPGSALAPAARLAIGDLYSDPLKDPKKAIDAYQELAERHPDAPEVRGALERSAKLFDERLRQHGLAVEMHEKVVTGWPKTPASLKALKEIARLQRDKLSKPAEGVKALARLSQMHGGPDGVEALLKAADWARRDLKDMARQAELLRKVADDYAAAKEAPQALYDAAGVYESDLKQPGKAAEVYKEVASRFPSHKLAGKAADRAAKLEASGS